MRKHHGYTLTELLLVLAIIGLTLSISLPAFHGLRNRSAIASASNELRSIFRLAASRAVARGRNSGVKFFQSGTQWQFAIYDDMDGDGVRNDDIDRGVDRRATLPRAVFLHATIVTIALPSFSIRDPDGDLMSPKKSPVQFGNSTICSFSPLGESSPGTIYLRSGNGDIWAVRVSPANARSRMMQYDGVTRRWATR